MPTDNSSALERFHKIEGMTGELSALTWLNMFAFPERAKISGQLVEIGTYKGKTASLLGEAVTETDKVFLVDLLPYLEFENLSHFKGNYDFWLGDSTHMPTMMPGYERIIGKVRFLHTDASHTFANVVNDLKIADELLHEDGIVAVDDYSNTRYPQVPAATSYAIFTEGRKFSPFLVTDNKAYLCRPAHFGKYLRYVRDELFPALNQSGSLILSRSDDDERYSPFSIAAKMPGETEDHWGGTGIYATCFEV